MRILNKYKGFYLQVMILILGGLLTNSCKKSDPIDCFKNTGADITESRNASAFYKINLEDNVNLVLTQDSVFSVKVKAGKNIISKIETTIDNKELTIKNNNSCNWVRSFDREVIVYVSVNHLNQIEYSGSGDISCTNVIISDSLLLQVKEGAGLVDLTVDVERNYIYFHIGTADIYYRGRSHISYISATSFGPVDARNMSSTFTFMANNGSNNCYVQADVRLEATIGSLGNIYYAGNPEVALVSLGQGKLYRLD